METKFQTSFIPKKTAPAAGVPNMGIRPSPKRKNTTSIFMIIGVVIFVLSLAAAGGSFVWKKYLISAQKSYEEQLKTQEERFDVVTIERMKLMDSRIKEATDLIQNHIAISKVFDVVSRLTVESVRFTSMQLSRTGNGNEYKIDLSGYGVNLPTVAFQSDVLSELERYDLRKVIKNPIISDPTLNPDGTVSFSITASLEPSSILYGSMLSQTPDENDQQIDQP